MMTPPPIPNMPDATPATNPSTMSSIIKRGILHFQLSRLC